MHFVVHALDKPGALPRRMAALEAHRAFMLEAQGRHGLRILMSGPLTEDDGGRMKGSFFLIEAPDRDAVEGFFAEDPMAQADVWAACSITAFHLRVNAMKES